MGLEAVILYTGQPGYDCADHYADTRTVAHPAITWPWYLVVTMVVFAISLLPLLKARHSARSQCW